MTRRWICIYEKFSVPYENICAFSQKWNLPMVAKNSGHGSVMNLLIWSDDVVCMFSLYSLCHSFLSFQNFKLDFLSIQFKTSKRTNIYFITWKWKDLIEVQFMINIFTIIEKLAIYRERAINCQKSFERLFNVKNLDFGCLSEQVYKPNMLSKTFKDLQALINF